MPETASRTENGAEPATRRRNRALTVVTAIVAAVAVWAVAGLFGVDMQVRQGGAPQPVGVGLVIAAAAIGTLLGWALLAGLERFTGRARITWTVVAVLVTVLSLGGPFLSATTTGTAVALALMHVAVGAVAIPGFRRTTS